MEHDNEIIETHDFYYVERVTYDAVRIDKKKLTGLLLEELENTEVNIGHEVVKIKNIQFTTEGTKVEVQFDFLSKCLQRLADEAISDPTEINNIFKSLSEETGLQIKFPTYYLRK